MPKPKIADGVVALAVARLSELGIDSDILIKKPDFAERFLSQQWILISGAGNDVFLIDPKHYKLPKLP